MAELLSIVPLEPVDTAALAHWNIAAWEHWNIAAREHYNILGGEQIDTVDEVHCGIAGLEHFDTPVWQLVLEHSDIAPLEHLNIAVLAHCCIPVLEHCCRLAEGHWNTAD